MGIIDRYLLRQFLQTFLICFLSLTGLYIVIDAFTNLESFLECGDQAGGWGALMGRYYLYRVFFFFDMTAGMLALIAAMFTITWIQRHNEMTALLAAGVSRIRVATPVIAAAAVMAVLGTVNRELVIPQFRHELTRSPSDLTGLKAQRLQPHSDARTDVYIRGEATVADQRKIIRPSFLLPNGLDDYGNQLDAESAFYRPPEGDRPGGYLLTGVQRPKGLDARPSLFLPDGTPVLITSSSAPGWLKPGECFVASGVSFDLLTGGTDFASTAQLISGLHNPSLEFNAGTRVEIHSRIVHPFLDLTLLFLGLPLVLSRDNRNVFIAIGLCVAVVSVFVSATIALKYLGSTYLVSPSLAAWAPLLVFVPIAAALAGSMRK
ncbi:MAG: LptF/LptG family permease [Pirellulales bacterium]|nr:LptF/LptG family permease [Pirellulales bacterium]